MKLSKVYRETYANAIAKGGTPEQAARLAQAVYSAWRPRSAPATTTMTIDLPTNVQWPTPDLGVAVIPGEPVIRATGREPHHHFLLTRSMHLGRLKPDGYAPPKLWVERQWCETCGGKGLLPGYPHSAENWHACPDCCAGRRVWEVRWPCLNDPHHERHGRSVCKWCNGNVFLSARATVHVEPEPDGRNWRVKFRVVSP